MNTNANINVAGVTIGTEVVHIGDNVGPNHCPWIKAMVIGIEETVGEFSGEPMTELTVVWLKDERQGNTIARRGRVRKFVVTKYGTSDVRKVA